MLILLDSDCVFNQSIATAFKELDQDTASAKTYVVNPNREYKLHGLTGGNMKELFEEFGVVMKDNPFYSGGELLFAKGEFFKKCIELLLLQVR